MLVPLAHQHVQRSVSSPPTSRTHIIQRDVESSSWIPGLLTERRHPFLIRIVTIARSGCWPVACFVDLDITLLQDDGNVYKELLVAARIAIYLSHRVNNFVAIPAISREEFSAS